MTPTVGDGVKSRQPSPPTARAIRVVELLADTSMGPITIADIVRRTGQSRATAHAIVSELVEQGWAMRSRSSGEITLGPVFTTLATRVTAADPLIARARVAMTELSDDLHMPCFVARRVGPETISVVDQTWIPTADADGSVGTALPWITRGHPITLRPPFSREFFAWASHAEQDAWIAKAPAALRTRLRLALSAIAERGYSIERMTDDYVAVTDALNSLDSVSDSLRSRMGDLLTELTTIDYLPDELHGDLPVITIGAPVFDAEAVTASLVACPNRTMTPDALHDVGSRVRTTADGLSAI
ncbi:helix-turn-helix domain-containing protein [Gordonia sp. TBRC 11910]|uniref:Helix-turn-helix domain-containing protein n=1 Tax=Gordonia asplenii TaxID=2725283 RepID=A0A848L1Y3_9ACTN|nr:helix-turn-helix domain-containing protein [Gordonia asplenii]NMO04452.1 helix-turn-helix domain-containing protein [Gordonia asplenii]